MKSIRAKLKKLSPVVATLLLLASILLSAHYHTEIKTAEKDSACSICQISHSFSNGLQYSTSFCLNNQSFFEALPHLYFSPSLHEKISAATIRGPPSLPSV